MEHILFGIITVLVLIAVCAIFIHALIGEGNSVWVSRGILFVLVVIIIAVGHKDSVEREAIGPCVKEEIRHVLVGKVMTPYKVCVERGEWVK